MNLFFHVICKIIWLCWLLYLYRERDMDLQADWEESRQGHISGPESAWLATGWRRERSWWTEREAEEADETDESDYSTVVNAWTDYSYKQRCDTFSRLNTSLVVQQPHGICILAVHPSIHVYLWYYKKSYSWYSTKNNKKAQLSLTNPRDAKACQKLLQFDVLTTLSLTILAYLHAFSCCCVRNLRNPEKFTENSNLWSSRPSILMPIESPYVTCY